ncbi:hypothetical protein [Pseudaestuariivita atlantica]|uniref:hypothetical protein n=1 Tax=Pseudaestuariivita atlantica TaxID=1317121 RepID=UPI000B180C4D|nr:hypothetical protein [Pseudaestuariivita atlantica]
MTRLAAILAACVPLGPRIAVGLAGVVVAALGALPAAAQGFQPPDGCTGFLTVQSRTCQVANYWTCEGDLPGDTWRVTIGPNGPTFVSRVNNEAEWVESFTLFPVRRNTLMSSADPMSMSELLGTGVDTYDFLIRRGDVTEHVTGFDRVVGGPVTIDGEELLPTAYAAKAVGTDGEVIWEREGNEFISNRHRVFFSGSGTTTRNGETVPYDFRPVEFIYPGEPGFFPNRPKYDCDSLSAGLDAPGILPAAFAPVPEVRDE